MIQGTVRGIGHSLSPSNQLYKPAFFHFFVPRSPWQSTILLQRVDKHHNLLAEKLKDEQRRDQEHKRPGLEWTLPCFLCAFDEFPASRRRNAFAHPEIISRLLKPGVNNDTELERKLVRAN